VLLRIVGGRLDVDDDYRSGSLQPLPEGLLLHIAVICCRRDGEAEGYGSCNERYSLGHFFSSNGITSGGGSFAMFFMKFGTPPLVTGMCARN
jgi:hypothetical protein